MPKQLNSYKKDQIEAALDYWKVELTPEDNTHFEKAKRLKDAGVTPEKMAAFVNGDYDFDPESHDPEPAKNDAGVATNGAPENREKIPVDVESLEHTDEGVIVTGEVKIDPVNVVEVEKPQTIETPSPETSGSESVVEPDLTPETTKEPSEVKDSGSVAKEPVVVNPEPVRTSFVGYSLGDLRHVADSYGVDYDEVDTEDSLVTKIELDGITEKDWNDLKSLSQNDEIDDTEPAGDQEVASNESEVLEVDEDFVLVKMTRPNYSYEAYGYSFSQDHPYALVKESDADLLIENEGGFQIASPKEAKLYYS